MVEPDAGVGERLRAAGRQLKKDVRRMGNAYVLVEAKHEVLGRPPLSAASVLSASFAFGIFVFVTGLALAGATRMPALSLMDNHGFFLDQVAQRAFFFALVCMAAMYGCWEMFYPLGGMQFTLGTDVCLFFWTLFLDPRPPKEGSLLYNDANMELYKKRRNKRVVEIFVVAFFLTVARFVAGLIAKVIVWALVGSSFSSWGTTVASTASTTPVATLFVSSPVSAWFIVFCVNAFATMCVQNAILMAGHRRRFVPETNQYVKPLKKFNHIPALVVAGTVFAVVFVGTVIGVTPIMFTMSETAGTIVHTWEKVGARDAWGNTTVDETRCSLNATKMPKSALPHMFSPPWRDCYEEVRKQQAFDAQTTSLRQAGGTTIKEVYDAETGMAHLEANFAVRGYVAAELSGAFVGMFLGVLLFILISYVHKDYELGEGQMVTAGPTAIFGDTTEVFSGTAACGKSS